MPQVHSKACRAVFDPEYGYRCETHKQRLIVCDCCGMFIHVPNRKRGPVQRFCSGACRVRYWRRVRAIRAAQTLDEMLRWMEIDGQ